MDFLLEPLGYLASALVALSLMMRSLLRLRLINLAGAVCFTLYGVLIQAYPVAVVNGFIVLIDLYFLYQMTREREHFSLAEVRATSDYLHQFLRFYRAEIERFQPGFTHQPDRPQTVLFVLRDMVPAGLVITEPRDAESLWIALDFVTPAYRDFRVAEFVFRQNAERFRARGVHALYSAAGSPVHAAYLRRLGFAPVADGFRLTLAA